MSIWPGDGRLLRFTVNFGRSPAVASSVPSFSDHCRVLAPRLSVRHGCCSCSACSSSIVHVMSQWWCRLPISFCSSATPRVFIDSFRRCLNTMIPCVMSPSEARRPSRKCMGECVCMRSSKASAQPRAPSGTWPNFEVIGGVVVAAPNSCAVPAGPTIPPHVNGPTDCPSIRSASVFESKLVNAEPIPVLIDWLLIVTLAIWLKSPNTLLGNTPEPPSTCPGAPPGGTPSVELELLYTPAVRDDVGCSPPSLAMSNSTPSSIDVVIMFPHGPAPPGERLSGTVASQQSLSGWLLATLCWGRVTQSVVRLNMPVLTLARAGR